MITAIGGRAIGSSSDLGKAIRAVKPGGVLRVTWSDTQGSHTASVRLTSGPAI